MPELKLEGDARPPKQKQTKNLKLLKVKVYIPILGRMQGNDKLAAEGRLVLDSHFLENLPRKTDVT